jgi:hypothetical protein
MTVTILTFDYYTFDVLTANGPDIPPISLQRPNFMSKPLFERALE